MGSASDGLRRLSFGSELVLHDRDSGRLWLFDGEAATAWRQAGESDLAAALGALQRAADAGLAAASSIAWARPDTPPAIDLTVAHGGPAIRVRCWEPRLARVIAAMLAPITGSDQAPASTLDVVVKAGRTAVLADDGSVDEIAWIGASALVRRLARDLNGRRAWLGVVHAATVLVPAGAVVIAGRSGSGKTTLAAGLLAAGAASVADDATPIEARTLHAWPCPLAMGVKEGSWAVLGGLLPGLDWAPEVRVGQPPVRYVPPPRRAPAGRGQRVASLLFPTWTAGSEPAWRRLAPSEALRRLIDSGTWPPQDASRLEALLAWLLEVPAYALRYDALADGRALVDELLTHQPSAP